ncbi:16 kDa beta-galactoside-binding lectin-like isoform X1 [Python bivittatus]|uniref:Galectin n=1 Tax=Python bivittatus TaxID=176946 RepID=A0A9F5J8T3_PYTBI|nr:16 kDa beta-galactoside-binding lectin-like isoform X1 [Python bivittatus]
MAVQLVAYVKIRSGDCIKVKGKIEMNAKSFALNLGQDESELILHFNPRFESQEDVRTVVCNSKSCGEWGIELRESEFPFYQGEDIKLFVYFDAKEVIVKMPRGHEVKFPNRMEVETVEFFSIVGDLKVKSVKFD